MLCFASIIHFSVCLASMGSCLTPHLPASTASCEKDLLKAALQTQVVPTGAGFRQFDLTVAEVSTWEDTRGLVLRLWLPPEGREAPYPWVAYVHGGHFMGGSPMMDLDREGHPFGAAIQSLLEAGLAVAAPGYRLAREAGWPAPVSDVLCGLRFLVRNGHFWNLAPGPIGISGHSAGARLAGLISMIRHDGFHQQDLPWQDAQPEIAAVWLWAGSVWDEARYSNWVEFGKPRWYSVPRLHFGEHPAWDDDARHRWRIRHTGPHFSMSLPPLHLLRGASDYGGDHSDAQRAVELWRGLGAQADLSIVPGGHSATGPHEPMVAFFNQHLRSDRRNQRERHPEETALRLIELNEPLAALEVLHAAATDPENGCLPEGEWILLSSDRLLWLSETEALPPSFRDLAWQARKTLASREFAAAMDHHEEREWFQAREAARNALLLNDGPGEADGILSTRIEEEGQREASIFRLLHEANLLWHTGDTTLALEKLRTHHDSRVQKSYRRLMSGSGFQLPPWAERGGIDVYGTWIEVVARNGFPFRFRWVEPGNWTLPEKFWYRNTTDAPFQTNLHFQKGFWLAEVETTRAAWQAISAEEAYSQENPDHPVTGRDFLEIVEWLELATSLFPGVRFRLPTEEEWLHAASHHGRKDLRASVTLHSVHALGVNPGTPGPGPVNEVVPDLLGFHGLLGGVQEWTSSPGRNRARFRHTNGENWVVAYPVARGGGWATMPHSLHPSLRQEHRHGNRQPDLGFRILLEEETEGGGESWLREVYLHLKSLP